MPKVHFAIIVFSGVVNLGPCLAAPNFSDTYSSPAAYDAGTRGAPYLALDEDLAGTWTANAGVLTYSRPNTGRDPNYVYSTSLLLAKGSTPANGSTEGFNDFTVSGNILDIPAENTAQPGLVVSGSREQGGYVLTVDNGLVGQFALLSLDADQMVGDEGNPQRVIQSFGKPTLGDSYSIVVTEHRPSATTGHPSFDVLISSTGPTNAGLLYAGSFTDAEGDSNFGGRQIGYRVRDPLDGDTPAFGTLTLSVPEPGLLLVAASAITLLRAPRKLGR